jgi:anthranilate 1,2-dioxygenase small subunit
VDIELQLRLQQLVTDYSAVIDEDRLEEWPGLFVENCRYVLTNRENHQAGLPHGTIYASSRGMLTDRVSALRDANIYEPQVYRHMTDGVRVIDENDGIVDTRTSFIVARIMHNGETSLFATGVYLDKIDVSDASARFIERIVVCDSSRIDTLLAIPL